MKRKNWNLTSYNHVANGKNFPSYLPSTSQRVYEIIIYVLRIIYFMFLSYNGNKSKLNISNNLFIKFHDRTNIYRKLVARNIVILVNLQCDNFLFHY